MKKRLTMSVLVIVAAGGLLTAGAVVMLRSAQGEAAARKEAAADLKLASSKIDHVTIYQNNALVTRMVDVPEGLGTMELVVSPSHGVGGRTRPNPAAPSLLVTRIRTG